MLLTLFHCCASSITATFPISSLRRRSFHPGTVNFGLGGNYTLEWGGKPEVVLDLEIKPRGITVYAQLTLAEDHAGIEISHIAFQDPSADPDENTIFLKKSLREARYSVNQPPQALAG